MFASAPRVTPPALADLPPLPESPVVSQPRRCYGYDDVPLSKRSPKKVFHHRTSSRDRTNVEVASTHAPPMSMPRSHTMHSLPTLPAMPQSPAMTSALPPSTEPRQRSTGRNISNSFQIPQFPDMSLIKDCSIGGVSADETFDFGIDKLRAVHPALERDRVVSPGKDDYAVRRGISPSVSSGELSAASKSTTKQASPSRNLPKSTSHIGEQGMAVHSSTSSTLSGVSRSGSIRQFADLLSSVKTRQTSTLSQPSPSTRSKRTFPASSSGQSLASVGEEPAVYEMAIRTPLPTSPTKKTFDDDEMEVLAEQQPLPPSPAKHRASGLTSRLTSPVKDAQYPAHSPAKDIHAGDVSLDINALMAKMSKPKRASGTEESFVDLLHDNESIADVTMIGADESFLPSSMSRFAMPRSGSAAKTVQADRKSYSQNSPSQAIPNRPQAEDTRGRRQHGTQELEDDAFCLDRAVDIQYSPGLGKSKSHSRMASAESARLALAAASPVKDANSNPVQSLKTLAATPREQRHRIGVPPPSSRRISLSAGAAPLGASASHKILALPTTRIEDAKAVEIRRPTVQTTGRGTVSTLKTPSARLSTLPQPRPTTVSPSKMSAPASAIARPRPSALPSGTVGSARLSTAPRVAPASARPSTASRPPTSRPTTFRPTSTVTRTSALPKAGAPSVAAATGLSRPLTTSSREFGKDATSATNNRLPLPSFRPTAGAAGRVKMSMDPSSPSKRVADPKTRGLSMPPTASASRTAGSASVPALPRLGTHSTQARSIARIPAEMTKTSAGLAKPSSTMSRGPPSKSGTIPMSSRTRTESTASAAARSGAGTSSAAGISAIRARLGEIEARRRLA